MEPQDNSNCYSSVSCLIFFFYFRIKKTHVTEHSKRNNYDSKTFVSLLIRGYSERKEIKATALKGKDLLPLG